MAPDLSQFDDDNEALASELVAKVSAVIDLCQAFADPTDGNAEAHEQVITSGREALVEIAAFFEVDLPEVTP